MHGAPQNAVIPGNPVHNAPKNAVLPRHSAHCALKNPQIPRNFVHDAPKNADFRLDWAKSTEIHQKEGVSGSEIVARNRKSLATFHCTLKSQCNCTLLFLVSEIANDFWGPQSRKNHKNRSVSVR